MTDEEKKAIEYFKRHIIPYYGRKGAIEFMLNDIVLNLFEKQSKEIEELKNEVMEKELIIDGMKEDRRIAVEEIQEQYYISKDKLKPIQIIDLDGKIHNVYKIEEE